MEKKALEAEVLEASLTSLNAVRSCSTAAMSRLPVLAVPARVQVANWKQKQAAAALEESRQRASRQRRVARLKVQYAPALAVAELPCADAIKGASPAQPALRLSPWLLQLLLLFPTLRLLLPWLLVGAAHPIDVVHLQHAG